MRDAKNFMIWVNHDSICKSLNRDLQDIVFYAKKRLSINVVIKNGEPYFPIKVSIAELKMILREYIEYFVICQECRLPETIINIKKDRVEMVCHCCSATKPIADRPNTAKMIEYYLSKRKH